MTSLVTGTLVGMGFGGGTGGRPTSSRDAFNDRCLGEVSDTPSTTSWLDMAFRGVVATSCWMNESPCCCEILVEDPEDSLDTRPPSWKGTTSWASSASTSRILAASSRFFCTATSASTSARATASISSFRSSAWAVTSCA